jgi:hypothetical protein
MRATVQKVAPWRTTVATYTHVGLSEVRARALNARLVGISPAGERGTDLGQPWPLHRWAEGAAILTHRATAHLGEVGAVMAEAWLADPG